MKGLPSGVGGTLWRVIAVSVALADAGFAGAAGGDVAGRLVLVGVVLGHPGGPIAVIEDGNTGREALYHVGDPIEGAAVVAITADRAVLKAGGQAVELRLAASRPRGDRPARFVPPRTLERGGARLPPRFNRRSR